MSVNLGDKVKDKVSGFTGIATARHEYLNGCVRISVDPDKLGKEGAKGEGHVFDEPQLEIVKRAKVIVAQPAKPPGGPRNDPARPSVPAR